MLADIFLEYKAGYSNLSNEEIRLHRKEESNIQVVAIKKLMKEQGHDLN